MVESRLDLEEKKPLTESSQIQEKLNLYNERSLVLEDDERIIYLFDYNKTNGRGEILNRHVLKKLKDNGHWKVIRHPLVLNFVNEKVLSCTVFYGLHVLFYFIFLFLLYSYIHGPPTVVKNLFVSLLVIFFAFFMLIKATLKLQDGYRAVSFWFQVSYAFNFLTLAITLFYVWSFYLFNLDDYNKETKRTISWFLPIVAILSSWLNCLYILRKAPCGPYIMMMSRILYSFLGTTIIWIPTLFCFAFSFQLVMRDSGTHPWDDPEILNTTSSVLMVMFQSFTKTSAMMIGEVEANDILERKAWVANLLLILFEIITVILLMNLMISLAVGDVQQLRQNAEDALLKIKVNFCIEALHLSEQVSLLDGLPFVHVLHRAQTNNVLVIHKNTDEVFSQRIQAMRGRFFNETNDPKRKDNQAPSATTFTPPARHSFAVIDSSVASNRNSQVASPHRTVSSFEYQTASLYASPVSLHVATSPSSASTAFYSFPASTVESSLSYAGNHSFMTPVASSGSFATFRSAYDIFYADPNANTLFLGGGPKVFDLVLGATGLRLRKEVLTNRSTLMSIQGATFHLVESTPSGINPVLNSDNVKELLALRDDETRWRKFQRWLLGLNWKALLVI